MSKATAVLFISLGLVLCAAASSLAQGSRLEITSGVISSNETAFWQPTVTLIGANFRLDGVAVEGCCGLDGILGGSALSVPFATTYFVVDGTTYANTSCCPPNNSGLVLFSAPFTFPTPLAKPLYAGPNSTPFTMSGHIELGPGFDVVGRGIFTVGRDDSGLFLKWDFRAPEP